MAEKTKNADSETSEIITLVSDDNVSQNYS